MPGEEVSAEKGNIRMADAVPARNTASDMRRRTLAAIRAALMETLFPELVSNAAQTAAQIMLRLLDHMIADEVDTQGTPLDLELSQLWTDVTGEDASLLADVDALEARLPALLTGETSASTAAFLHRFAACQQAALVRRDPEAAGGVADMYRGGKTAKAEAKAEKREEVPLLTPARLTKYLRERFPEFPAASVASLTVLPGGFSKQTVLVTADQAGTNSRFVIRKNLPINPTARSVVDEFPLLSAVWAAGTVPIAQPLWLEADPAVFGAPAMAVAMMPGNGDVSTWAADPAKAARFADDLARAMAALHALPLDNVFAGRAKGKTAQELVADEIESWYSEWRRWRIEPRPIMEAVYAWLKANIPAPRAPAAIVHSDIGFHNLLIDDGKVTALLDWEFSHPGDPAEDLVYARPFIEQVIDWETFLARYEAHGGQRPSPDAERFYAVWQGARNSAGCAGAQHAFLTNEGAEARLGVSGMTFLARFELDAFQRIIAA
jgi:aminoglycoside phosphotransferase (APT) family kinase protein